MGNTQPHNKTGRKVVEQKLENAGKTGVLSLSEHKLEACPSQVYQISKLTTLDLSKNKLKKLDPNLSNLKVLKSLNVDHNKLTPGSLAVLSSLPKLKSLSVNHNQLGNHHKPPPGSDKATPTVRPVNALPTTLPKGLKTILLSHNALPVIPTSILEGTHPLKLLEKLNLSSNQLVSVPDAIASLQGLTELQLDDNLLQTLPSSMGSLTRLKVLSLRRNQISMAGQKEQPLPEPLFAKTLLIDLNLHGNPMTTTQLNTMDGYEAFLSRRREVKNKDLLGGALTDLEACGLD